MPYIPGKGWTSIVTGRVEPVRGDDRGDPMVESRYARQKLMGELPPGVGIMGGMGVLGFPEAMPHVEPQFPLLPLAAAAVGGIVDWAIPGAGLIRRDQPVQPQQQLQPGEGAYGVPFGGPGLKEPGGKYLLKEWHIRIDSKEGDFNLQFYLTQNDRGTKRVFMYNQRTKAWKSWPMPRLAVIGKNLPSHQMITRLRRNLKRHTDDAVTILKLTAPGKLESTRRGGGRYITKKTRKWVD
ncbi:hypothetical protein ES705_36544 [subsurface metagenome]